MTRMKQQGAEIDDAVFENHFPVRYLRELLDRAGVATYNATVLGATACAELDWPEMPSFSAAEWEWPEMPKPIFPTITMPSFELPHWGTSMIFCGIDFEGFSIKLRILISMVQVLSQLGVVYAIRFPPLFAQSPPHSCSPHPSRPRLVLPSPALISSPIM